MHRRIYRFLALLRSIMQFPLRLIRGMVGWDGFWWIIAMVLVLSIGVLLSWVYWEKLGDENESLSTTIRNVGLPIGGIIAMLLAVWRSTVAARQVGTAQESLLNDQYQRGADMLGSGALSVRMGAIHVLRRLADTHPEKYHIPVMELFCVFARYPTMDSELDSESESLREDVQAVMNAIGDRSETGLGYENAEHYRLQLSGVDLRHANLCEANLTGANLSRARLNDANLLEANLSCTVLVKADLTRANATQAKLCWADLSNATLHYTNLSGAVFRERVTHKAPSIPCPTPGDVVSAGLTHFQLHLALANPDNPPILNDVIDAETGHPLVWEGNTLGR